MMSLYTSTIKEPIGTGRPTKQAFTPTMPTPLLIETLQPDINRWSAFFYALITSKQSLTDSPAH